MTKQETKESVKQPEDVNTGSANFAQDHAKSAQLAKLIEQAKKVACKRIATNCQGRTRVQRPKDFVDDVMQLAGENVPESTICDRLGIEYKNWEDWKVRYPFFIREVKRLRAASAIESQREIMLAGKGWQAHQTLLERTDPANWSRQSTTGSRKATPLSGTFKGDGKLRAIDGGKTGKRWAKGRIA